MKDGKKHGGPSRRPISIDGVISSGRQLGVPTVSTYKPGKSSSVPALGDTATDIEGFHPLRSAPGGLGSPTGTAEEAALLDEPIVLDDGPSKPKKHRLLPGHPKLFGNLKRTGLVVLALIFIIGAYLGVKFYITEHHLFRGGGRAPALAANVDINQLKGEGDGRINVLLLGIGGPGHDGPDLTDTIMIASIDPVNNKLGLLSIPRDLWIKTASGGGEKINAVYALAKESSKAKTLSGQETDGINAIDSTLETVLGIPIHYHVVVDFKAFQDSVNAVGGVDANVPPSLTAYEDFWVEGTSQHYLLNVPAGQQHFDGTKALYYARERHNDSDFARAQRQRLLLTALKDKAFSVGTFSNPVKISNLLSSLGSNVFTDFSVNDMSRLYQILKKIPSNSISSLDLVTPPNDYLTTGTIGTASVVEPKAGLYDYTAIQNYVRNVLRDSFLAKENASIAVYNATDTDGLASKESTTLKSFGYTITTVGNTAQVTNPATTMVVDLSKGKDPYTRHYLEERFNVTAATSVPPSAGITPPAGTDFVIILGKDVAASG